MSTPSVHATLRRRLAGFLPTGRAWWLIGGAFAGGLLLFALVLKGKRDDFNFYRAGDGPAQIEDQAFDPLPAPLPAGADAASGMDANARVDEAPRIDQHAPPPAVATQAPAAPGQADGQAAPPGTSAAVDSSVPRPVSTPAPNYPPSALRAGISGAVVLRMEVGVDGKPGDVEVVTSSRNRDLDREAVRTVRRWRFQPAMRDGVPVPAVVRQTINFSAPE